jgi:predicted Mrr-cat superfamily restriction endonuclease
MLATVHLSFRIVSKNVKHEIKKTVILPILWEQVVSALFEIEKEAVRGG